MLDDRERRVRQRAGGAGRVELRDGRGADGEDKRGRKKKWQEVCDSAGADAISRMRACSIPAVLQRGGPHKVELFAF